MTHVIGIDLGTTNSCVGVVENGSPRVFSDRTGQNTMPSVVALTESGKTLIGHLAKRQAITNPARTIYGVKRLIGRRWDNADVQKARALMSYDLVSGPHDDIRVVLGDEPMAVPEISAMVLAELRNVAAEHLGSAPTQAVITVPAYFNDNQRQATVDAGRIAGLDVLRIINEPTAAALAYGFGRGLEQKVAVYDLGGGTFDISVLQIGEGVFEVLSSSGDTFLGGEDFDERIMMGLLDEFKKLYHIDLHEDRMALQRLKDAAERVKIDLSSLDVADVNLPFIFSQGKGQPLHLQQRLTRTELNDQVQDLVDKTLAICRQTVRDAGLTLDQLDGVVLVGGMTRMPLVQSKVSELFGRQPSKGVHPDEVVACGAAIQGHLLSTGSTEALLLDVTPHDLGIMVAGGTLDVLIEKDTTIPTQARKVFTTVKDKQTQVRIVVMQAGGGSGAPNELLGEFVLDQLPPAPKGDLKVEVQFDISADGIVSVAARDVQSGYEQAIKVTASSGLTEEEIQQMVRRHEDEMVTSATASTSDRDLVKQLLDRVVSSLPAAKGILQGTDFGREALLKAKRTMAQANAALADDDDAALREVLGPLERTLSLISNVASKLSG